MVRVRVRLGLEEGVMIFVKDGTALFGGGGGKHGVHDAEVADHVEVFILCPWNVVRVAAILEPRRARVSRRQAQRPREVELGLKVRVRDRVRVRVKGDR